jgi:ubiquinone biosynthesis protein UbiJ
VSGNSLLQPLQALLNRHLQESSVAREQLGELDGESLQLKLQGVPFAVTLLAVQDELLLGTDVPAEPSATISGTLLAAAKFARGNETTASAGLNITGDAEIAAAFIDILKAARPDLEEELSRFTGDVAAHQIGNLVRGAKDFATRTAQTLRANSSEYLTEEAGQLPPRNEVDAFYDDLAVLRDDVERLGARLDQLNSDEQSR